MKEFLIPFLACTASGLIGAGVVAYWASRKFAEVVETKFDAVVDEVVDQVKAKAPDINALQLRISQAVNAGVKQAQRIGELSVTAPPPTPVHPPVAAKKKRTKARS